MNQISSQISDEDQDDHQHSIIPSYYLLSHLLFNQSSSYHHLSSSHNNENNEEMDDEIKRKYLSIFNQKNNHEKMVSKQQSQFSFDQLKKLINILFDTNNKEIMKGFSILQFFPSSHFQKKKKSMNENQEEEIPSTISLIQLLYEKNMIFASSFHFIIYSYLTSHFNNFPSHHHHQNNKEENDHLSNNQPSHSQSSTNNLPSYLSSNNSSFQSSSSSLSEKQQKEKRREYKREIIKLENDFLFEDFMFILSSIHKSQDEEENQSLLLSHLPSHLQDKITKNKSSYSLSLYQNLISILLGFSISFTMSKLGMIRFERERR